MRSFSPAILAALQSGMIAARVLVWFEARNRATSAPETLGVWTGGDNATMTVEGQSRSYFGAGNIIDVPPVSYRAGLDVQVYRLGLTAITNETRQLIRSYDPRFAAVQIHRALFDPATRAMIEAPHRVLTGFVDEVDLSRPAAGEQGSCYLSIVTTARQLTYGLPNKNSDENQKRVSGDRFLRYADASAEVWWGAERGGS